MFSCTSVTKYPMKFVEDPQKVLEVMHVADAELVKLDAYKLKSVSRTYFH